MIYQYSIEELASSCKVSVQSIRNLISKNKDFITENSKRHNRKIRYNQAVLDYFLDYYGLEAAETADSAAPAANEAMMDNSSQEALETKIAALEAELEATKEKLAATEKERRELLEQNGALILTIREQQQEKLLYLPAPKKTIGERLKGLFSKKE